MQITMVTAGLMGFLLLMLGVRIVLYRRRAGISLGTGGDAGMETRVRAHGNAAEWIPIGLILLFLAEQTQGADWLVGAAAALLVVGRLLHPFGMALPAPNAPRVLGMVLTWAAIGGLALMVLVHGIGWR